ncbi:MAG: TerB family tellurite resistance protein [Nannocystaceae bacterium]
MSIPENMSAIHILGFLYLSFTHSTDGELSGEEIKKVAEILKKWVPNAPDSGINQVMIAAGGWYNSLRSDDERLAALKSCTDKLDEGLKSQNQRDAVIMSLIQLARADGKITESEEKFIADVTAALGVNTAAT